MKKKLWLVAGLGSLALIFAIYQGVRLTHENDSPTYEPLSKRRSLVQQANNLDVQQGASTDTIVVPPPATPLASGVPGEITIAAPVLQCVNGKLTAKLAWTKGTTGTTYLVEKKQTGASDSTWVAISPTLPLTTLTYTDPALTQSGSWTYQVHALNNNQDIYSNETVTKGYTCTTATPTPTPPSTGSGPVAAPTPVPTPTPTPVAPPPSSGKLLWGAYNGWGAAAITDFEKLVGKQANMQAVFVGWGSNGDFPDYAGGLKSQGKTLVIFWEPSNGDTGNVNQADYNYDSITSGKWDSYIASFAADAKAYGGPVILVPFEEMNGDWYPWSGTKNNNSQAKEIAAFKYLRKYFPAGGNVKIAWAPNSTSWPNTTANNIAGYYPGSENVDIVALDGFNFNNPWETFSQVFDKALAVVKPYGKPIYIVSMASCQGASKPAWITDALTVQMPKNGITGFVWFNTNKECDWRVNSDAATLAAFKAALP